MLAKFMPLNNNRRKQPSRCVLRKRWAPMSKCGFNKVALCRIIELILLDDGCFWSEQIKTYFYWLQRTFKICWLIFIVIIREMRRCSWVRTWNQWIVSSKHIIFFVSSRATFRLFICVIWLQNSSNINSTVRKIF